jgi:hypothetical protein
MMVSLPYPRTLTANRMVRAGKCRVSMTLEGSRNEEVKCSVFLGNAIVFSQNKYIGVIWEE